MVPPQSPAWYRAIAHQAFKYKVCPHCGKQKVRDVQVLCTKCFDRLPESLQRGLKDSKLFTAAYHAAIKYLDNHG
jgi:hypothetical protein